MIERKYICDHCGKSEVAEKQPGWFWGVDISTFSSSPAKYRPTKTAALCDQCLDAFYLYVEEGQTK